jgi:hypothetical protein
LGLQHMSQATSRSPRRRFNPGRLSDAASSGALPLLRDVVSRPHQPRLTALSPGSQDAQVRDQGGCPQASCLKELAERERVPSLLTLRFGSDPPTTAPVEVTCAECGCPVDTGIRLERLRLRPPGHGPLRRIPPGPAHPPQHSLCGRRQPGRHSSTTVGGARCGGLPRTNGSDSSTSPAFSSRHCMVVSPASRSTRTARSTSSRAAEPKRPSPGPQRSRASARAPIARAAGQPGVSPTAGWGSVLAGMPFPLLPLASTFGEDRPGRYCRESLGREPTLYGTSRSAHVQPTIPHGPNKGHLDGGDDRRWRLHGPRPRLVPPGRRPGRRPRRDGLAAASPAVTPLSRPHDRLRHVPGRALGGCRHPARPGVAWPPTDGGLGHRAVE